MTLAGFVLLLGGLVVLLTLVGLVLVLAVLKIFQCIFPIRTGDERANNLAAQGDGRVL